MVKLKILLLLIVQALFASKSLSQDLNFNYLGDKHFHDSSYIISTNVPKNKFIGNSWYFASSYNLSSTNEFDINLGRTYGKSFCGGAGCIYEMYSWGAGYGISNKKGQRGQHLKVFGEYCFFYYPPFSAGLRADYIYDITQNAHFFRPSAGLSLFLIDVFFNYSFKIYGTDNPYKFGITFRLKFFHKIKNWQENHPSRC
jgi:hypothetical protein